MIIFLSVLGFTVSASAMSYYTASRVTFTDLAEFASSESDFGLYSISDPTKRLEIFSYTKEPLTTKTISASQWAYLNKGFGLYYGVHTGGKTDPTADYFLFSNPLLNKYATGGAMDTSLNHIAESYTAHFLAIGLEDQLGLGDKDYNDMIVSAYGRDLMQIGIAPVPEPSTMLLFGAGAIGLAGVARRKKA